MGVYKGYKQTLEHKSKRGEARKRGAYFECLCKKQFWRRPSAIKSGDCRFCSKDCYFRWQKGRERSDDFKTKCRNKRPEQNGNWRGGITPINAKIRASGDYKNWRESVFKRDNWTCQKCNTRSKSDCYIRIEAHHIKPFALFPELRFVIDNGLTLCKKCHDKEPKGKQIYLCSK